MEKGKQLFSYLGSVFTFCMLLALTVFLPGAKADAALSLEAIDYDNSTITIGTNSGDTTLYFSDKNKAKWETAMDAFVDGKCTMDISWVSVTKDYVMTFKGDKTVKADEILTVTIPKQVSNFKVKYEKKGNKVTFTNKPSDREVQYRKNNTSNWATVDENTFGNSLQRLCENGAKVYFRLKAVNGSNGNAGKRYSKEVMCSITKKSEAPKITINDDATITVQSGLQVRRVTVKESGGVEYVMGYDKINSATEGDTNYDDSTKWYTYRSERDVPITEMAAELEPDNGTSTTSEDVTTTEEKVVYLQFRKEASSSAQVSHISTVKIPKQEAAPSKEDISIEYTSFTTFNLKIAKATTKTPYEYCIVSDSDVKEEDAKIRIIEPEDTKWKMISSNVATEVKKSEAPQNSFIFLRKKAVGKLGDENFRLTTDYVCAKQINYPVAEDETLIIDETDKVKIKPDGSIDLIDGVCTTDNQDGYIKFNITTRWNAKIKNIYLMKNQNPTADDKNENAAVVTQTSSVTKLDNQIEIGEEKEKVTGYSIAATIKEIKLTSTFAEELENSKDPIKLYAYIEYDTPGESVGLSSNDKKGLVISLSKKSSIEIDNDDSRLTKTKDVKRIIGATRINSSDSQNEEIKYKVSFGNNTIKSVTLGNCGLEQDHYKLEQDNNIFTVYLAKLEKEKDLEAYYGKKQNLVVELSNGEKLNDITITFVEPVSLDKLYSWAYRPNAIPKTEQTVETKLSDGSTKTETKYVNNYSVEYVISAETINDVKVQSITAKSATLGSISVLGGFDSATKKIEFSNDQLKKNELIGLTSAPVKIAFDVTLSNGYKYEYVIKQGCMFTVLS